MIVYGHHHLTGEPRITVECDTDGCERAEYLPDDVHSPGQAARLLRHAGWQTSLGALPGENGAYLSMCPTHSTAPTPECTHLEQTTTGIGKTLCRRCGKEAA